MTRLCPVRRRLLGIALAAPAIAAHAQVQKTELSVQAVATATDNGDGAPAGQERADLLFSLRPRIDVLRQGAGLQLRGSVEADMAASARGTRRDRILPIASVDAHANVVERLLFLDAAVDVRQVELDPYGVRAEYGSTRNARTAGSYRISPYVDFAMGPRTSFKARLDGRTTRVAGTEDGDATTLRGSAKLDLRPEPVGASLEWLSEDDRYSASSQADLRIDRLLASLNWAVDADWVVGIAAGSERSKLAGASRSDSVVGLRTLWVPGPRTELAAAVDRRFFGTGWNLGLRHRTPRISVRLRFDREPMMAGSVGTVGLATFLDSILTTRNPDIATRSGMVRDLAASRGLQSTLAGASTLSGGYAQLRTASDLNWVYLGTRTTLTLSVYGQTLRLLTRDDASAALPTAVDADNRQRGASFGWNRRLSPLTSLDAGLAWSRIEGLGQRAGQVTREESVRASLVRNLSQRTSFSAGIMARRVHSSATNVNSFDETAGFLGLGHRF